MRILYGVCGEGMGHAMRSAVVGAHLERRGHEVVFASNPGKALEHLERHSSRPVLRVVGTTCALRGNRVAPVETLIANAVRLGVSPLLNLPALLATSRWRPDAVISDFDPWSAYVAHRLGVPLLAVDNIHFANRCSSTSEGEEASPAR